MALSAPEKKMNVNVPLDYVMLATAVSRKNVLDLSLSRYLVGEKVKEHHEFDLGLQRTDIPMICPPIIYAVRLFNASLAIERRLFPYQDVSNLFDLFQKRIVTNVFCNIDVEKVLEDDGWKEFFRRIECVVLLFIVIFSYYII